MRILLCLAVLFPVMATIPLRADWKITTRTTDSGGRESVETHYLKGNVRRYDSLREGFPPATTVVDGDAERQTIWDLNRKEFVSISLKSYSKPASIQTGEFAVRPVLLVEMNTTDTGERQTILGRTARHLITVEKRSTEETPGAEAKLESEAVKDAWYVDAAALPAELLGNFGAMIYSSVSRKMPVVKRTHAGPVPTGLVVKEKVTWRSFDRSGSSGSERLVTELQECTLTAALFAPPVDSKRVEKLANTSFIYQRSFGDELETYWNSFENWLFNLFS